MRSFCSFLLGIFLLAFTLSANENVPVANQKEIIEHVQKNLPLQGVLRQAPSGFVYLDVDDAYIFELIPYIAGEMIDIPPYFDDGVGAHITVITQEELFAKELFRIDELGEEITFSISDVYMAQPETWNEVEHIWALGVSAPRIEAIRQKYNLPAKVKAHEFHITFALEWRPAELQQAL